MIVVSLLQVPLGACAAATSQPGEGVDETGAQTGGETDESGGEPVGACEPPALLELDDIPDDPSLDPGDDDIVATFEVDGHQLTGKFVTDSDAAQGGLALWQELTLRVPENQLLDLVQLDIYLDTDPVARFNRTGNVTTKRLGLRIGFSVENFALNDPDPCAPLQPRRGTFDWSLVHEFGHLRGFVDGTWMEFLTTFPDVRGEGLGYPEDGSPILTGDFVTDYAERADGDEDYAETWTTYVMLGESDIPAPSPDEPLALQKLRWIDQQPDLRALREAIRLTEDDAVVADVPPAPRIDESVFAPGDSDIVVPFLLHGQWRESESDGVVVTFSADDIVLESRSLAADKAAGALDYFEIHNGSADFAYSFIGAPGTDRYNHDFYVSEDAMTLRFARETLVSATGELEYLPELTLSKVAE